VDGGDEDDVVAELAVTAWIAMVMM